MRRFTTVWGFPQRNGKTSICGGSAEKKLGKEVLGAWTDRAWALFDAILNAETTTNGERDVNEMCLGHKLLNHHGGMKVRAAID